MLELNASSPSGDERALGQMRSLETVKTSAAQDTDLSRVQDDHPSEGPVLEKQLHYFTRCREISFSRLC
ncbi:MAG: hypothetical protein ACK41X_05820 [Pseudorhodoplanes sp.]